MNARNTSIQFCPGQRRSERRRVSDAELKAAQIFTIPRFILGILNLLAVGGNRTCLDRKAGGQKLSKFLFSKTKTQCASTNADEHLKLPRARNERVTASE